MLGNSPSSIDHQGVANPREPELRKVLLSWSSGKDSTWALHLLRQQPDVEVVALLTTFNSVADRGHACSPARVG
jgi:tRNA(Ile)-lysidine synthase TilS/MesJ